ncbi:MAG: PDZ domain-containing protein [Planctomycetaceae bacterium]|nr:PDZ domain-containing protein [Planctomycetaceae bacterium]
MNLASVSLYRVDSTNESNQSGGDMTVKRLGITLVLIAASMAAISPVSPVYAADGPERAIERVSRRVVKIFGAGGIRGLHAYSTGFLVSPQGHLVTVWSHVLDDQSVTVVLHDGRRMEGKIVAYEPQLDLAVLKVDGDDLPYFDLDDAVAAPVGARVLAFSNMFKVAAGDEPVSVLHGVIAARTKLSARKGSFETPYTGPVYVVDAITNNPGSGGGVLTTRDGTLVGMIGKELRNTQTSTWVNYAIPIGELKTVIGQIIEGKFVAKTETSDDAANPRRYAAIDFGIVLVPDVLYRTPAFVDGVIPDSPAARAGIRPNDLVLFVNDELIQSCRMFREDLGRLEAGDTLKLVLRRGNSLVPVELPVEKKEVPEIKIDTSSSGETEE